MPASILKIPYLSHHMKQITLPLTLLSIVIALFLNSCQNAPKSLNQSEVQKAIYPSDIIPFFDHWNLILGDGSNAGLAINYEHSDFFYSSNDEEGDWVVFKAPNAGDTHGTSNNTRTELAQTKKMVSYD